MATRRLCAWLCLLLRLNLTSTFTAPAPSRAIARRAPRLASPHTPPRAAAATRLRGKTRALEPAPAGGPGDRLDRYKKRLKLLVLRLRAALAAALLRLRTYAATDKGRRVAAIGACAALALVARAARPPRPVEVVAEVPWSQFLRALDRRGAVADLVVGPGRYTFLLDGRRTFAVPAELPGPLATRLLGAGVEWRRARPRASPAQGLAWMIAFGYLAALGRVAKQMMGGGVGSVGARGRRRRRPEAAGEGVTFDAVAGVDEAKREVAELVTMMAGTSARAYAALGARPPRGVLLVGPPGTGKTLLARALATTARAPFLSCSGSEFVEMFVGRGAARVRQLFDRAKAMAPCVVFIDEIDALGRRRRENNFSLGGANDEAEQTLNQLLACMDGVDVAQGVVVLAATNRLNVLDPALVRPGRFDRVVKVPPPDLPGREQILRVHAKKVSAAADVDLGIIARETKGLVGADLAAIVNEAAIRAVRRRGDVVDMRDFRAALADFYESRAAFADGAFAPFSMLGSAKGDQPAT